MTSARASIVVNGVTIKFYYVLENVERVALDVGLTPEGRVVTLEMRSGKLYQHKGVDADGLVRELAAWKVIPQEDANVFLNTWQLRPTGVDAVLAKPGRLKAKVKVRR